jgi:hypothetical protein
LIREDSFPSTLVVTTADFPTPVEELKSRPPTPGAATLTITRVIVTHDTVMVLVDDVAGPKVVFQEKIDPKTHYKGSIHVDSYVTTVSGKKLAWRKDAACGCGSRLRSFRPFKHISSSKDPGPDD